MLSLQGTGYRVAGTYTEADELVSPCFPDLRLNLRDIFPTEPEDGIEEIRETPPPYSAERRPEQVAKTRN